ncbi:MAG: HAMP domain-containing sensor histidine kinase [Pseudomonadota bacterium]|nr:HAMP domain-containing sensor histidine kinase [Pseudomonadota bacterium]
MISIAPAHDAPVDWDAWRAPLQQFAQATGLVVSAYDAGGDRTIGPLLASRSAQLLAGSTLWHEAGPGSALERHMVAVVLATNGAAADEDFHGMRVCSLPLTQFGQVYGVLVFGWRSTDFSSPMACERLGKLVGVAGHALWNAIRLEAPVAAARLATFRALLHTLAGALDRQRETIEQLNQVNRTRELFLATVSHEMRTPLSALSMRIDLMLKTLHDLPPALATGLQAMRVHVRQEAGMVDDLIDAARTLTGQLSIARSRVPLGRIVRDAVSTIEVNAHDKAIAFSVAPADFGDRILIAADARRLQQVLWNLLLNAIKFTPAGGAIKVNIHAGPQQVEIEVIDSGQGIAADDLPHVFGAFTLQRHANASGLGLGLYIARRIVELHGGALTVASAGVDRGSTFTIRLPLEAADAA